MAKVLPFQPYRYTGKAGRIEDLVTQPYDKITPSMRTTYLDRSAHNFVRILLGEKQPTDSASDNVYTRAGRHLEDWLDKGILSRDPNPGFYPYFQEFTVPETGERVKRKGFIGLGPVEEYSAGIVHRHEQTLSGPKQDRLELLRATYAHLGQIFVLYEDPQGEVDALLDAAAEGDPLARATDEYEAVHRLWRIDDPDRVATISRLMEDKKLLIADGHHRYETALAFHTEIPALAAAARVMMTFINMHSPGLRVLATHRLVSGLRGLDAGELAKKIEESFLVTTLPSVEALRRSWGEPRPERIRIGVAVAGSDTIYLLEASRGEGQLDVSFLHDVVLEKIL
ncbi:MAG: DUF1015 domain-containing protein, partial [bacterium]|nr:DUF1015 domain-containing protein [bacterium]